MEISHILGLLSSLVMLVGIYPYLKGVLTHRVQPHLFSWLVWGILTGVGFLAQMSDGAGAGAWITLVNCLFCFTVAALSLKFGEKNITRSDWLAFIASLSAIPLWIVTDNPFWSVILITVIDAIAFWPTIRKTWLAPMAEEPAPYICSAIAFSLALMAMEQRSFITSFYPFVLVLLNVAFVAMVFVRRKAIPVA